MILSDATIEQYIDSGKIKILPEFKKSDIRPTGIRLHLVDEILVPVENQIVDLGIPSDIKFERIIIPEEGYQLEPGTFILGATFECIKTPRHIVCHLEGRSTIARLGLSIHCTSGVIDNNHDEPRSIVLEIKNSGPFRLIIRSGIPIGMLLFNELSQPINQRSQSQYKGQYSVEPPNTYFITKKTR